MSRRWNYSIPTLISPQVWDSTEHPEDGKIYCWVQSVCDLTGLLVCKCMPNLSEVHSREVVEMPTASNGVVWGVNLMKHAGWHEPDNVQSKKNESVITYGKSPGCRKN